MWPTFNNKKCLHQLFLDYVQWALNCGCAILWNWWILVRNIWFGVSAVKGLSFMNLLYCGVLWYVKMPSERGSVCWCSTHCTMMTVIIILEDDLFGIFLSFSWIAVGVKYSTVSFTSMKQMNPADFQTSLDRLKSLCAWGVLIKIHIIKYCFNNIIYDMFTL